MANIAAVADPEIFVIGGGVSRAWLKNVKLFQNVYIPASLLGGICGLLLGPQVLGHFIGFSLPIGSTIAKWPGVLVNIVLGVSFFGATPE